MSILETLMRQVWDYSAIPLLFLLGFIGLSAVVCLLLIWLDKRRR
ncbi:MULTISPECIES: TIGR02808 family protein [Oceanisphaera]|uniref:TIGR02808 family protein n=1 Tax=Oceanisphaera ostreae TaxID=914151 RepID=A0ABW3KJT5_9GAMM